MRAVGRGLLRVGLATALACTGGAVRADDGAPSRKFPRSNFEWTLPTQDWTFEELTPADIGFGYVAKVKRIVAMGKEVVAWARQDEAKAASLDVLMAPVKESAEKIFSDLAKSEISPATWAGVPGSVVIVSGALRDGRAMLGKTYGAILGGKFYRLEVSVYGGAERKIPDEIDALVAGYKFLKIPTAPEPPATPESPAGPAAPANPAAPATPIPGMGDDAPGGTADSGTRLFPKLNLAWTLPKPGDGKPDWSFTSAGKADLSPAETGWLAVLEMRARDGGQPIDAELSVRPCDPGRTAADFVDKGKRSYPIVGVLTANQEPTVTPSVPFGNSHAALLTASGTSKNDARKSPEMPLELRVYVAVVKGVVYQLDVFLREGAGDRYDADVKALVDGLHWQDVIEGVRGPVLWPFPMHSEPRGDFLEREIEIKITKAHGFTLKKPPGWALWKIAGAEPQYQMNKHQIWWFVGEARKEGAYCLFGVVTYLIADLVAQVPVKDGATLIDDYEKEWKVVFPDGVTRPRGKTVNKADGSFLEGKGSTYDFRGTLAGAPYYEKGWLVRTPQYVYWIRTQYGGKDAETTFAEAVKNLSKGFVYEK